MVDELITALALEPHPEGGFYKRTYCAENGSFSSILFLLKQNNFSAFHQIKSEEQWNWMGGDAIHLHEICADGSYKETILSDNQSSPQYQYVVKGGHWFASECKGTKGYALCGCTVIPAFHFEDFILAERHTLTTQFPQHTFLIQQLTRLTDINSI